MSDSHYTGIHRLKEIVYQQPGIGGFPMLQSLPLRAGFSWGEKAEDMSHKTGDKNTIDKAYQTFFSGLHLPRKRVHINPNISHMQQIEEVDAQTLSNNATLVTGANILFTKATDITLTGLSGDCPYLIIFAKDKDDTPILGIVHAGRTQADMLLPQKAIEHLASLGVLPQTIKIGITPGISQENYFVPKDTNLIDANAWGEYKEEKGHDEKALYFLDIHGYILKQLIASGIQPKHIEMYDIDTYVAAKKEESFSHRYAIVTHQPEKDGRFLVAASLA